MNDASIPRRLFLASAAAGTLPAVTTAISGEVKKKGWCGGSAELHQRFRANWYYNWTPNPGKSTTAEFVPMIKGAANLNQSAAIKKRNGITHLLGFNEPERAKQGNVSVAEAVKLWPRLETLAKAKNLRLGSPACSGEIGMKWFRNFMAQAKDKGLRMDFLTFHFYRLDSDGLERFLENLADQYDLPIWLTEFNGWNGNEADNYRFLKESLRYLERARHVERYAYFNFQAGKPQALIGKDGELTRLGHLYREAGR